MWDAMRRSLRAKPMLCEARPRAEYVWWRVEWLLLRVESRVTTVEGREQRDKSDSCWVDHMATLEICKELQSATEWAEFKFVIRQSCCLIPKDI